MHAIVIAVLVDDGIRVKDQIRAGEQVSTVYRKDALAPQPDPGENARSSCDGLGRETIALLTHTTGYQGCGSLDCGIGGVGA